MNRGKSTIQEVAKRAGVAASTAAEIIRFKGKSRYSIDTCDRVMMAAQALNYIPSSAAKALASRSTRTIGVILQSPLQSGTDRFIHMGMRYAVSLDAINYELDLADYNLMIGSSNVQHSEDSQRRFSRFMREQHADGVIVYFSPSDQLRDELERLNTRYVVIEGREDEPACQVSDDEEAVGCLATEHLIGLGHRSIAFFNTSRRGSRRNRPRQRGYLKALTQVRLAPWPGWDEYLPIHEQIDQVFAEKIPTAMITYDESDAFMAIKHLAQRGLRVPSDISVIALTDEKLASSLGDILEPSLTIFQTDLQGLGSIAVEKILQMIEAPSKTPESTLLTPTLKIRESTGPPGKGSNHD